MTLTSPADELDPRVVRTRETVMEATVALLAEVGFQQITIDAIAVRSRVARSTIYRNWPDRSALLAAAFRHLCPEGPAAIAPSGVVPDDLWRLGQTLASLLTSDQWSATVPSLIGAAIDDPALQGLMADFADERRQEARLVFSQPVDGRPPVPDEVLDTAIERFVAPFFFRRLMSHLPLDDAFIEAQVEAAMAELGRDQGANRPGPNPFETP